MTRPFFSALAPYFWGFLLLAVGLSAHSDGCGRAGRSKQAGTAVKVRTPEYLLKKMAARDVSQLRAMTARADLSASGDGGQINASANIIWLKDSVVWVNVKKFGLEAARALITPDSVFVLNRLEKTCSISDLKSLQDKYSLPGDFALIQGFITGSPWFFRDIALQSDIQDSLHHLYGQNALYSAAYFIEEGSYSLRRSHFAQLQGAREVLFGFDGFKDMPETAQFPLLRTLLATSPETGKIAVEITLKEVAFNTAPKYKFEIPGHYTIVR
jgi:hypothetical protein